MKITDEHINRAKKLDLPHLFRNKNIELISTNNGSSFKCLCPFHEEKTPSLQLNLKEGLWLWNCFGCNSGGTAIDFIMKYEKLDFLDSVRKLIPETTKYPNQKRAVKKNESVTLDQRIKLLNLVSDYFYKNLLTKGDKAKEYLKKRGIYSEEIIKTFKIGFSTGNAKIDLKEHRNDLRTKVGLFSESYHERLANCVVFPVFDSKGNCTDIYGRRIVSYSNRSNHCYNTGKHLGLFNYLNVKDCETVIIAESIIDALSIYKSGLKNVTALYGANGFTEAHETLLTYSKVKEVIFALDNDKTGKESLLNISSKLKKLKIKQVVLPENIKDINELLIKKGEEDLKQTVLNAVSLKQEQSEPESKPEPEIKENVQQSKEQTCFSFKGSTLLFNSEIIKYTVRNVKNLKNLDSLRFVITALKEGQTYTDRIDLYISRSRKFFESAVSKAFGLQPAVVEGDLLELVDFIEEDFNNRIKEKKSSKQIEMSSFDKQSALTFLKTKNLMEQIIKDITNLGYVGEDENKLLLYLCATSRKLSKPISVLIRSQSSTGKSFLIDKICDLLPEEDVHKWTSLTPKALYYMAEDALKHKFLAIDEREGMEEAEYPIRSLQSGNRLSLAVPIKNPSTGKMITEQVTKEGPISYVDGSTDTRVNPENANRCFEIYLDESSMQTKRVQAQQRLVHTLDGWTQKEKVIFIKRVHQNAQRLLKPVKVIIPYINQLKFPSDWIRTRRDHDRFLSLIVCITYLHQYQREWKQNQFNRKEYIESTIEDYELAYKVASVVIFNTFQELEKPLYDFYASINKMVETKSKEQGIKKEEYWFSRKDVRIYIKLQDYLVHRYIKRLTELEYLQVKGKGNGSRQFYQISTDINKNKILEGLTKPEELKEMLKQKTYNEKQHCSFAMT